MIARIGYHALYCFLQIGKDRSTWSKVLLVLPLAEVLPFLVLGRVFLATEVLDAFLLTNIVWTFLAATVMQCLFVFQVVAQSSKLDLLILSDGGLMPWIVGYCGMTGLIHTVATAISCAMLSLLLGYPVDAWRVVLVVVLATPVMLSMVSVVLGIGLRFSRTFHLINASMDVLQMVACVLYPLAVLPALLKPISVLTPLTWLNQYCWSGDARVLLISAVLSVLGLTATFRWVAFSVEKYRREGTVGHAL